MCREYLHTYIHTLTHTYTYIHAYIHTYIHTYVHSHTYICTYIHTYLLTPWSGVLLEKLTVSQLVKEFPKVHYPAHKCPSPAPVLSQLYLSIHPHPTSWRSILILSSHLRLILPSGFFPLCFPTKMLYTPLLSLIHATCPAHLILLDFIFRKILGEQYRSLSSSLCSLLYLFIMWGILEKWNANALIAAEPS